MEIAKCWLSRKLEFKQAIFEIQANKKKESYDIASNCASKNKRLLANSQGSKEAKKQIIKKLATREARAQENEESKKAGR